MSEANISLYTAIGIGTLGDAKQAVEQGADVNMPTKDRYPLHLAVVYRDAIVISFLLNNGANINQQDKQGKTALHHAVERDHLENLALLMRAGADCLIKDHHGKTPTERAVENGSAAIIKLLEPINQAALEKVKLDGEININLNDIQERISF